MEDRKEFYNVEEAAKAMHVSDQTVRRWIRDKKLKAYRPGKSLIIRREDLIAFLESKPAEKGKVIGS